MNGGDKKVFIDTNVLVYFSVEGSPFHSLAKARLIAFQDEDWDLCISYQIIREYISAMTRTVPGRSPYSTFLLFEDLKFFQSDFFVFQETPQVYEHLLSLIKTVPVGGKQIHDANIVATMMAYGIPNLLTYNVDDFKRFFRSYYRSGAGFVLMDEGVFYLLSVE